MITMNDKRLIAKAEKMHWMDWIEVQEMAKEAESEEAKETLNRIASHGYHMEEAWADMI